MLKTASICACIHTHMHTCIYIHTHTWAILRGGRGHRPSVKKWVVKGCTCNHWTGLPLKLEVWHYNSILVLVCFLYVAYYSKLLIQHYTNFLEFTVLYAITWTYLYCMHIYIPKVVTHVCSVHVNTGIAIHIYT